MSEPAFVCFFYGKYADCRNINPLYCGMCKHWLCDLCRNDYDRRIKGMFQEKKDDIGNWIKNLLAPFGSK